MLASFETEHRILIMMGMRSSDIDDIDVLVFDELLIGSICSSAFWNFALVEELLGSIG